MTDGVKLRPWRPEFWTTLAEWAADPELRFLVGGEFPEPADLPEGILFGIFVAERLVGWLELFDVRMRSGTAELRIGIGERWAWNRGFGREAVKHGVSYAFSGLKLRVVYLRVLVANRRAVRCYLGSGFRKSGVLRAGRRRFEGHRSLLLMEIHRPEVEVLEGLAT